MEISKITETKHFGKQKISRLKNDASHTGLGAVLEQQYAESWFPIAYASRFLSRAELKYSTNELDLLSVVWATDHFKYYLLGSIFDLITNHTAPTFRSQTQPKQIIPLGRQITFTVNHIPGKDLGFTDYLSRHPNLTPPPISSDELFVVNRINDLTFTLWNEERKGKILTDQNTQWGSTHKSLDLKNQFQPSYDKANAFCHFFTPE